MAQFGVTFQGDFQGLLLILVWFLWEKICSYHLFMGAGPLWFENFGYMVSKKLLKLTCFLVKYKGGEKMGTKR